MSFLTSAQVLAKIEAALVAAGYTQHMNPATFEDAPETTLDNLFRVLPLPGGEIRAQGASREVTRDFEIAVAYRVANRDPAAEMRIAIAAEDTLVNAMIALEEIESTQQTPLYNVTPTTTYVIASFTVTANYCRT